MTVLAQITPKEGAAIVARPERGEAEAADTPDAESADDSVESAGDDVHDNDADVADKQPVEAEIEA
ncbi:hypothetical protein OT109_19620 [Phycisphaeraceae bacterium D3-23]